MPRLMLATDYAATARQCANAVRCIADLRPDLRRTQPDIGRDDGHEATARASAKILRPEPHDDDAIRRDFAMGRRGATPHPRVHPKRTHAGLDRAESCRQWHAVCSEFGSALLQITAPHRIRLAKRVLDPEFDWIRFTRSARLIHDDFGIERTLWMAGRAHGPLLTRVGENVLVVTGCGSRHSINIRAAENPAPCACAARSPRLGYRTR